MEKNTTSLDLEKMDEKFNRLLNKWDKKRINKWLKDKLSQEKNENT